MKEKKGMLMKKVMEKIIEEMRVEKEIVKIAELRMEMSELTREVEELRSEKEASHQFDGWRNQTRTQYSLSPDPSSARYPNVRKHLELMNHEYKKAFWKKEKWQSGFQHMVNIKDQKLVDLQPLVPWDDWVEGLEAIIDNSGYHLDEISESNTEKIQNVLRYADMIKESIQNIKIGRKRWYDDQLYIENDFKSPRNAPAWAISSSYHSG
ncbi:hypothetical protein GLOIN_2v1485588 [Rhizophagus irregularis DAOM 181602=DAOM 197198]|uniref:Uncharacterized protein n=1 Tax=Rhizophagus irregularis (strain DAOM 181602 / DAOM 197198 / MUCL 43194) TaxID=747089 RepID=A0A2P4PA69_RHIID|nr:hypothetical protein GLOIN_2v1485588 [Rhizophagus irregularis DAOM 181602=DAOM 197198]POG62283.1 hypothetical protein GLOIN_2v1485588 [Rhizophagus irregularis DAOM 181602=DAOM 197198]|eukprot:XP_025169149.1 hypothetical protein GLOIN_2v1485588 [Rhizophagus irregularis DAOM 181602=DAOM 197198]